MERIAIVTICFNDREALEHTCTSVLEQTYGGIEFIIVDGGSTDGSVDVIKRYEGRIACWTSEKDAGIYDAQNKGWYMATAPFVLFLNAGDTLAAPDVIERVARELSPDIDIVYGDAQLADARGPYATKVHPARITNAWLMKEVVAHQAQFIRTDLLEHYQGYDKHFRIAADYALFARAFWQGRLRLKKIDLVISTFDTRGLSSSTDEKGSVARERKDIQRRYAPVFWYWLYHGYAALSRSIGR